MKQDALQSLKALLPKGQVFTDPASLISYEVDAGLDKGKPEGVVFPRSAGDIVQVVRWAAQHNVPLVARGAGTGLSGGAVADRGGIIVEFSHMHAILDIDEYGRSAVVQPALINLVLDERVKAKGLYFPPDPASQRASTIGGNVAENSGGPHCFKYGVTTNYVMGMHAVLADGRLVRIGGRALDYPAYDLVGLITGSEGTLCLMTDIFARLVRNPPAVKTMLAVFDSVEQAGIAVSAIIAAGLVPATLEMMDQKIIGIIEDFAHAHLPRDAGAILIVEVDGYPASLDAQIEEISRLLIEHGGRGLRVAQSEQERAAIWFARKSAAGAIARLSPSYYTVDITVPRSCLARMLAEVNQICERYGLRTGHVFHAGDGNLHPLILVPHPEDADLLERVHQAGREIVASCIQKNGSLSGEHGVGIEKRQYMTMMHTAEELAAMLDIKQVFDPNNVLNPGKIFPSLEPQDNKHVILSPFASLRGNSAKDLSGQSSPNEGVQDSTPISLQSILRDNVFVPSTAGEAATGLAALSAAGKRVHIRSSSSDGERGQGGRNVLYPYIICSTQALKGIMTYAPDDLYVTIGAGTLLAEIQSFLAARQKWLPLATPWPETTIGGLVATNVNAPMRMRYGSIRDLVLCATAALADGRVIRTGRPVIKNVAGYDLTKPFIGSHGTLGLLTDITLKIVVPPRARRTLLIPMDDLRHGLIWARKLLPVALVASAIVLCKNGDIPGVPEAPYTLAYTAEGLLEDVEEEFEQVRYALQEAGAPEPVEVVAPSGTDIWAKLLGDTQGKLLVRVGVPPKDVAVYVNDQAALLNERAFLVDIANGMVYAVTQQDDVELARNWIERLREPALALEGYAVVMDVPEAFEGVIDRWGYQPQALDIMRGLKARWDPQGILNAGEFIV